MAPDAQRLGRSEVLVRQLQGMLGGLSVRAGQGTLTWPGGSVASNQLAVSHGLGKTPIAVVVVNITNTGLNLFPVIATFTYNATQFAAQAVTVDAQAPLNTATSGFAWVAIG